ncbi:MAG: alpha/beta hydrolase family esterase [Caulobacteraceae bacterium]
MILLSLVLSALSALGGHALAGASVTETWGGRELIVHAPDRMPPPGARALVLVLHGGLGNAARIAGRQGGVQSESAMNLDAEAEANGFVVAYLSGTPVTRLMGPRFLGWNAGGGCCGVSAQGGVDDVAYIAGVVDELARRYGVDRSRVYGLGHSNGAMMVQRMICETHVLSAGVAISGPLNLDVQRCAGAHGRRILAIHGEDDRNVPLNGGVGPVGLSRLAYRSEAQSRRTMAGSGATYTLQILPGVDHALPHIAAAIQASEGTTLAGKTAAFFGLIRP